MPDAGNLYLFMIAAALLLVVPGTSMAFVGDKALSSGEIGKLEDAGIDPHDLKPSKNGSRYDFFKDGNISVKPKAGNGPGEPTGININNYQRCFWIIRYGWLQPASICRLRRLKVQ